MANRKKTGNIVSMKRRRSKTLGVILCLFSLYLLIMFIMSMTKYHLSIYEVNETQIADDETIRGLILRDEVLVNTQKAGYINYYVGEGDRVGLRTNVYSVDGTGDIAQKLSEMDTGSVELSAQDTREIRDSISNFREDFTLSSYNKISNFRYDIDNTVLQLSTVNFESRLQKLIKDNTDQAVGFEVVKAKQTGVVSFVTDGMENVSYQDVKEDYFKDTTDHWKQLRPSSKAASGTNVYKLVKSENWSIILPLTSKQFQKLSGQKQIKITMQKDDLSMSVPVTTYTSNGGQYAKLDLNQYMIQYLENRYIDVHIEFNHAQGLKIPNSSIIKKECYVFPKEYLSNGPNDDNGTYYLKSVTDNKLVAIDVYYIDDNDMVYIDKDSFEAGTVIRKDNASSKETTLSQTETLNGVYNCNQGYCRFQLIDKLYENEEYTIAKNNTVYGLSTYDHIILNPKLMKENQIIY